MLRLIDCLRERGLDNRAARHALEGGKVFINGIPTSDPGRDVSPFTVDVRPDARRITVGRDPIILHCDDDLAVVHKPAGMLSVGAPRRYKALNVVVFVARITGSAYPVHRLDEETSGLMIVARNREAQFHLKESLAKHHIERRYMALVRRTFPDTVQTFDSMLVRDRGDGKRGSVNPEAQPQEEKRAVTHVRLLETLDNASLVEAKLETGRTHQVRIHLSEAGYPILGDWLYGSQAIATASPRLALHAWHLAFDHVRTREPMVFSAPLPDDLERRKRALSAARFTTAPRQSA